MLLEAWVNLEKDFGELGDVALVQAKMPKKLKRRRPLVTEDGPAGYGRPFHAFVDFILLSLIVSYNSGLPNSFLACL